MTAITRPSLLERIMSLPTPLSHQLHVVEYIQSPDMHTITFRCRGDLSALCHNYPSCKCDYWTTSHQHQVSAHAECWIQSHFAGEYPAIVYEGDDTEHPDDGKYGLVRPRYSHTGFVSAYMSIGIMHWHWISYPVTPGETVGN